MKKANREKPSAAGAALKLLGRRDHSRQELLQKLVKRGYREEEVLPVLTSLEEKGYLDDSRFALRWLEYFRENKPMGRERLAAELARRGVEVGLARELVDREYPRSEEASLLYQLALQLVRKNPQEDLKAAMARVGPALARRGFGGEDIAAALEKAVAEAKNRELPSD